MPCSFKRRCRHDGAVVKALIASLQGEDGINSVSREEIYLQI
jgi:hypothetical protein